MCDLLSKLHSMADVEYRDFQSALIPNVSKERFIGVRTPLLRKLAREMLSNGSARLFLHARLPHTTFDEMQLHAFIVSGLKNFDEALVEVERLLPHVDNWATCDQLSPPVFRKDKSRLLAAIRRWLQAEHEYTVRFGKKMLMQHYLDEPFFQEDFLTDVASTKREEYYVRMMQAWFFATALAKQYEAALPFISQRRLEEWTHRKAIQKACESLRLTQEQKAELRRWR